MFSKLAIFAAATMATLVVAAPTAGGDIQNSCNTGAVQCCNQMFANNSNEASFLSGLFGVAISSITGQLGVQCNPITAIGVGSGSSCSSQPVCCSDNSFSGLIAIGCSPVNVNI